MSPYISTSSVICYFTDLRQNICEIDNEKRGELHYRKITCYKSWGIVLGTQLHWSYGWGVKAWKRPSSARVAPLACNVQIHSCVFAVNLTHVDWKPWFRASSNLLNNYFPRPPLSQPYLTNFWRDEWRKISSNDQKRRKVLANRRPNRSVESGRALKSLLCLPLWVRTERFPNISCPLKKKYLISFEKKIFHFLWKQVLNCDCNPVGFNTWVIIGHLEPRETAVCIHNWFGSKLFPSTSRHSFLV